MSGSKVVIGSFNLDDEELYKYRFLGISCASPAYKFIHDFNTAFEINLAKKDDISVLIRMKKNNEAVPSLFPEETEISVRFPFYYWEGNEFEKVAIIRNFNGEIKLYKKKNFVLDYVLAVFGSSDAEKRMQDFAKRLTEIPDLQRIFELDFLKPSVINDLIIDLDEHVTIIEKEEKTAGYE